jgi:hypothetical protein
MPTEMKLIFGLRASQPTGLVITIKPKVEALPLWVTSRNPPGTMSRPCEGGTWTVELAEGDHVGWIEGELDRSLQLTLTAQATIIICEPKFPPAVECKLKAWSVTPSDIVSLSGNDPKDPWPPPGLNALLPPGDTDWFTKELSNARQKIEITRG